MAAASVKQPDVRLRKLGLETEVKSKKERTDVLVALLESEQSGLLNFTRRGKPCAEANDGDLGGRRMADQISSDLDTSSPVRSQIGTRVVRCGSPPDILRPSRGRDTGRTPFSG